MIVAVGSVSSAALYFVGYLQLRRRFPARAREYIVEALLTAVGATVAAAAAGHGPAMWATAPAVVAGACFLAGKGDVTVLMHESGEGEDDG